eukprot:m51a1_g13632 putative signal recognition particle 72 kda protein (164) ;mRNA; f:1184-1764
MGDKKDKADPAQLFREIEALAQAGEHRRVAALSDRVLAQLPGDRDALLCKAVALAHLRRFDDALAAADACPAPGLPFERAYCLYRMRRNAEALDALAAAPAADRRVGLLRAQCLYRLERAAEAARAYEALRPAREPASQELLTNLTASLLESGTPFRHPHRPI